MLSDAPGTTTFQPLGGSISVTCLPAAGRLSCPCSTLAPTRRLGCPPAAGAFRWPPAAAAHSWPPAQPAYAQEDSSDLSPVSQCSSSLSSFRLTEVVLHDSTACVRTTRGLGTRRRYRPPGALRTTRTALGPSRAPLSTHRIWAARRWPPSTTRTAKACFSSEACKPQDHCWHLRTRTHQ